MKNMKALRMHLGWTITRAARAARFDPTTYARIERNRINATPAELARIADALAVTDPAWLVQEFEFATAPTREPEFVGASS